LIRQKDQETNSPVSEQRVTDNCFTYHHRSAACHKCRKSEWVARP